MSDSRVVRIFVEVDDDFESVREAEECIASDLMQMPYVVGVSGGTPSDPSHFHIVGCSCEETA